MNDNLNDIKGMLGEENEDIALSLQMIAKDLNTIDKKLNEDDYLEKAYQMLKQKTISNFKNFRDENYPPMIIMILKKEDIYKMVGIPLIFGNRQEEMIMRSVAKTIIEKYASGGLDKCKVVGILHYFLVTGAEYKKDIVKDRTASEFVKSKDFVPVEKNPNTFDAIIFSWEKELKHKFEILEYIMTDEDIVFNDKPRNKYEGPLVLDDNHNANVFYTRPDPFAEEVIPSDMDVLKM